MTDKPTQDPERPTGASIESLRCEAPAEHDARIRREEREAAAVKVDDLAMLVRQLVHSLRKHSPDNTTAARAVDYLKRHELQGSPLRSLSPAPDAARVYTGEKSGETFNADEVDALLAEAAADDSPMATEKEKAAMKARLLGADRSEDAQGDGK